MKGLMLGTILALALPSSALAASQYYIPPGNSSANQYVENVPSAGGGSPTSAITPGGSRSSKNAAALSPRTQSELAHQGSDGIQTATFADATAPAQPQTPKSESSHRGGHNNGVAGPVGSSGGGSPPAGTIARSLTGLNGPGASHGLLLILILVTLGVGTVALLRRRRAG